MKRLVIIFVLFLMMLPVGSFAWYDERGKHHDGYYDGQCYDSKLRTTYRRDYGERERFDNTGRSSLSYPSTIEDRGIWEKRERHEREW